MRRVMAGLACLVLAVAGTAVAIGPARATLADNPAAPASRPVAGAPSLVAAGPQPGTFAGRGFDTCAAPSQSVMNAWRASSPYRAVGVYISGASRSCSQPNLTATWVSNQTSNGWRLIPIELDRQAPCGTRTPKMSSDPATARSQGASRASSAVDAARALGIVAGSTIYNDIEHYPSNASCRAAVLSYLSGWTERLHALGYLSGMYSSGSSGVADLCGAYNDPAYTRVDQLWFAWWNDAADLDAGPYCPAGYYADRQRLHQYAGDVYETWGGVRMRIDRNYLDVAVDGGGGAPPVWSAIVDNATAGRFTASADWGTSAYSSQRYGGDYRFADPVLASDVAWFKVSVPETASYEVSVWYPANPDYNDSTPFVVATTGGNQTVRVNQRVNGGGWVSLGVFALAAGDGDKVGVSRWTSGTGYVIADAVRITRV
ncbi:glycoside hydrolase domain-containing protein [Plantactinospora sp. DSM 117369]